MLAIQLSSCAAGFSGKSGNTKMENGAIATSADLDGELQISLASFARLYSQHREKLETAKERVMLTAAPFHKTNKEGFGCEVVQGLLVVSGGALGALFGSVSGGACAAFGGISAAAFCWFCDDVGALGASVGCVCSVLGGVVGGVFGGVVGGALGSSTKVTGSPVDCAVSDATSFSIGFATGGAIGGAFGGTVGTAGGAIGGAVGALSGTRIAVGLVAGFVGFASEGEAQRVKSIQRDFMEAIDPLVKELKAISDKMASSGVEHGVAAQAEKTLVSVLTMEKTISQSETAELQQSTVEEAARQCKKVTEELETTREAVENLLVSLEKH